ncbi:uncharacterized protein ColSpa_06515 [Colletotrichum spaethianum]|uniref:Uncharacterized protein n=1 Tax=Colletotrichum spaethianum TaxID=700344 RepID=A0AA37LHD4_9PEZI|nr:uncharacterized protein ColSpa_06515 [Colletotrichum spaethianum]GKT46334.1 hypothetical protein ColSpa_06515 [Colletotrichum spaethianum]
MACQMLLTILVCPCSDQPAVALLVASGCLALMDTPGIMLNEQYCRRYRPQSILSRTGTFWMADGVTVNTGRGFDQLGR